jgi:CRISPR-associated protein Cas5t
MLGLYITVPIACFRKGLARDFWESEPLPPPSTCFGFLLALVGEERRARHCGVRVAPALLAEPHRSVVLRTAWRVKSKKAGLGNGPNRSPVEQELLTGVRLAIWLDSSDETANPTLEARVAQALDSPASVSRYGGLSLGESTNLVDEVKALLPDPAQTQSLFRLEEHGRLPLPVWVDHVGSTGTRYAVGDLQRCPMVPPERLTMPSIGPG